MATAKLTAVVETKGVKRADNDLKRFTKSANDAERKTVKLGRSFKDFGRNASASIAAIDGPLGGISSRITALTTVANSGSLAFTGLAVAATAFTTSIIIGTLELDKQAIALKTSEALIRATGNAAGVTAKQLDDEARAIAINTLASVDGIRQAQAVLLTFNKIQGDVREDAVALSQDLAQVFGGTAATQATRLGKALQDPIKGITALSLVGVTFTEQQKEQIKALERSGDTIAAQGVILGVLKGQVEGVAAAVSADTLAGGFDEFIQRIKETTEVIADSSGTYDIAKGFFASINNLLKDVNQGFRDKAILGAIQDYQSLSVEVDSLNSKLERLENRGRGGSQQARRIRANIKSKEEEIAATQEITKSAAEAQEKALSDEIEAKAKSEETQLQIAIDAAKGRLQVLFDEGKSRIDLIKEKEAQELEQYSQSNAAKLGLELEFARARKQIRESSAAEISKLQESEIKADAIKQESLEREKDRAREKLEQFIQINNTELEEVDRVESERLAEIEEYRDKNLTALENFEAAKTEIESNAQKEREDILEGLRKKRERKEKDQRDLLRSVGEGILSDLATIGGKQNEYLKAQAKVNAVVKTYESANSAYAALAPIPIVGPALGAAAAGVAIAAGMANVRAIDSAREQGGMLGVGQKSTVAERGLEILTPANASRVRTANDMKNIMGENQSAPNVNIVVIDQSDGNKEFDQSTDDEGRIVLLIRNTVAGDLSQSNSQISKSLGGNTTAQRRRA